MNHRRRRVLLLERPPVAVGGGGGGAATEDIVPTSTTANSPAWTIVGGAGSIQASLADASDSTYIESSTANNPSWSGGMGDLVSAAGRAISSFAVLLRADGNLASTTLDATITPAISGVTLSPTVWEQTSVSGPTTPTDYSQTFTKSGGGNFTEAQINSMTMTVKCTQVTFYEYCRAYRLRVRVTYA